MAERRGKGEDSIYFEHAGACRDTARHRREAADGGGDLTCVA
jgi:hypothetical protein